MRAIPEVPGVITAAQVVATAEYIASLQLPDGMIEWFPGGHCDPWNHVEAAMALTAAGLDAEADRGLPVAGRHPAPPTAAGSTTTWPPASRTPVSTPTSAPTWPPAPWHRYVSTGELDGPGAPVAGGRGRGGLRAAVAAARRGHPLVARRLRLPRGVRPAHTARPSMYHSLRCAIACAEQLGHERPDWELAAGRLAHAVAHQPEAFAPQGGVRHGLVLPGPGRSHDRRGGPTGAWSSTGPSSCWTVTGCAACPPASGSPPPRPPSACWPSTPWGGTARRPRAAGLGPGPAQRGRLVLDRHGLPRGGHLPAPRAVVLHGGGR